MTMPNQEPTAPVGARAVIEWAIDEGGFAYRHSHIRECADAILASLRANGLVIVSQQTVATAQSWADCVASRDFAWEDADTTALDELLRAALTGGE